VGTSRRTGVLQKDLRKRMKGLGYNLRTLREMTPESLRKRSEGDIWGPE
jgi:hypothetical protein